MEKRTLHIVVAILLAVVVVFAVSNFTGKTVERGNCIETDDGDDAYIPGVASYENRDYEYKDECYALAGNEKKWLKEYMCLDTVTANRYLCRGGCLENNEGIGYCAEGEAERVTD